MKGLILWLIGHYMTEFMRLAVGVSLSLGSNVRNEDGGKDKCAAAALRVTGG